VLGFYQQNITKKYKRYSRHDNLVRYSWLHTENFRAKVGVPPAAELIFGALQIYVQKLNPKLLLLFPVEPFRCL